MKYYEMPLEYECLGLHAVRARLLQAAHPTGIIPSDNTIETACWWMEQAGLHPKRRGDFLQAMIESGDVEIKTNADGSFHYVMPRARVAKQEPQK